MQKSTHIPKEREGKGGPKVYWGVFVCVFLCVSMCILAVEKCSQWESEEVSTTQCLGPSGRETKQDLPIGTHTHSLQLQMTYYPLHTQTDTYT